MSGTDMNRWIVTDGNGYWKAVVIALGSDGSAEELDAETCSRWE